MRYEKLDIMRGIAVAWMIFFHLQYSFFYIFWIQIVSAHIFWDILWKFSAITFLWIAWISFSLSEKKYREKICRKYVSYSIKLCWLALLVSLGSFLFFPKVFIIFGILHYFSLAFLLLLVFRKYHYWNILIWITLLILPHMFSFSTDSMTFYILWFTRPDFNSLDYYPLIPNFWYTLIGYAMGLFLISRNYMRFFILQKSGIFSKLLVFIGRHSLIIYVLHLPLLFIVPFFILYFFGK